MRAPLGLFAQLDETLGGICVAFEAARIPGEVDERSVQNLLGIGTGGLLGDLGPSDSRQVRAVPFSQIEGDIRAIAIEELAVVTDGFAGFRRPLDIVTDRCPCLGQRNGGFFGLYPPSDLGRWDNGGSAGSPVSRPASFAFHSQALSVNARFQAVLEGSERNRGCKGAQDLLRRRAVGATAD